MGLLKCGELLEGFMQEGSTGIQPPKGMTVALKSEASEPPKGKRKDSTEGAELRDAGE